MSEEKIAGIMRDFVKVFSDGDVEKGLSHLTDDATWSSPMGTAKGKAEIRRVFEGMIRSTPEMKVTECGLGVIARGDKAFFEHELSGTFQGKKWEILAMCAYEFSGDKIKNVRSVYDRLSMAKQAATGWFATKAVNSIINNMEKGMR